MNIFDLLNKGAARAAAARRIAVGKKSPSSKLMKSENI